MNAVGSETAEANEPITPTSIPPIAGSTVWSSIGAPLVSAARSASD
jgi:hypothetical protein